ncbi:ABC transporter permease [Bifidobacterium thermophilum]|uniref:Transporter n=1 Tax=Bifidobacterium thermophilum RBL67 TaxID=1254439 RepID=M4RC75_9BIFI|nr:FtsX-like permease family protein [Bifidobacterium thermophilum]AGH41060.1 transporter [Bifidobacterium thermophilum RBL67]MDW8486169.1 FtsX-like permease family protein [Bifidobacterium thermophilum]
MWSITIKMMKKNMKMLIPAGIAIMIGTAFIACTFLFGNTLNDTLRTQLTAQYAQANYIIQSTSKMSGSGSIPPTIGEVNTKQIASTDGVKSTYIQQNIPVNASTGDNSATLLAINASSDDRLLPVTMVKGHQPTGDKQIALPAKLADQLSVNIGDKVTLAANYGSGMSGSDSVELMVCGFTEDTNGAYGSYGGAAVIGDETMAKLHGADSESDLMFTGMTLDIDESKADAAVPAIRKLLPEGYSIETRQKAGDEALKSLSQSGTNAVTVFLMCFGILAMFVAALVIANTFQVLVAQRRRTLALLRTIGAQKGQLYRSVIGEAAILGLIASALGIAFGSAIMAIVVHSHALASLGMTGGLVFTWQVFVIPLVFGVVMTMLASIGSARSATRVTPLEALRPIEVSDNKRAGIARGVIGFLLITLGLVLTVGAVMMLRSALASSSDLSDGYSTMLLAAIAGCALIFIGLVVTAAFWMPLLMRLGGAFAALFGPAAKIAHANIQKNPRRVASTGVALLIGVTLVSCIGTGAACAKQTMNNTLDTHYSVDMVAKGSKLSKSTADKIAKIDGVKTTLYAPITRGSVTVGGEERSATLIGVPDTATLSKVLRADLGGVSLGEGKALAPTYSAFTGKILSFKNGQVSFIASDDSGSGETSSANTLTFSIIQRDYRNVDTDVSVTLFVNESYFQSKQVQADGHMLLAAVDTSKASAVDIITKAQTAIGESAGASLSGPIAERVQWNQIVDTMLALLIALLAVAVLIALIGVANTLSLSVIERTRESATLRAIGMTRGQLRWSLAVESLVISLVAGIAGEILGIAFGWVGSYMVLSLYSDTAFISDWKLNLIVLVVAAVAALLASVFPARRAVKTPPVEALAEA